MKRLQQGYTAIEFAIVMGALVSLASLGGIIWVAVHFISKIW